MVKGHLTLFHQLPKAPLIADTLVVLAQRQAPLSLWMANLMGTGRGLAYKLDESAGQPVLLV